MTEPIWMYPYKHPESVRWTYDKKNHLLRLIPPQLSLYEQALIDAFIALSPIMRDWDTPEEDEAWEHLGTQTVTKEGWWSSFLKMVKSRRRNRK